MILICMILGVYIQANEHHWGGILQLKEHSTHFIRPSRSSRKHAEMASPSLVTRKHGPVFAIRWINTQNKPKEYPQQPETKTVAKHAMSEVCLFPRPSYSRGRAYKAQSQHKHFTKNRFSESVRNTVAKNSEARAKAFSQRTAVRLTLHFIYLTYIIHISYVLYITYIFYTVFYTIFSRSTSTSTPSSSLSPSSSSSLSLSSSSPTSVSPTLSTPPTHVPSTSSI